MAGVKNANLTPLGYQQLTVSTAAVGLTVPSGARVAMMVLNGNTNGVRWRDDGVDPTAAIGMPISFEDGGNQFFKYDGKLARIKFIRSGGADAVLNISYYA